MNQSMNLNKIILFIVLQIIIFLYIYITNYYYEIKINDDKLKILILKHDYLQDAKLLSDVEECKNKGLKEYHLPLLNIVECGNDSLIVSFNITDYKLNNINTIRRYSNNTLFAFLYYSNWFTIDSVTIRNEILTDFIKTIDSMYKSRQFKNINIANVCSQIMYKYYAEIKNEIIHDATKGTVTVRQTFPTESALLVNYYSSNNKTDDAVHTKETIFYYTSTCSDNDESINNSTYVFNNNNFILERRIVGSNNDINRVYENDNPCREKKMGVFDIKNLEQYNKYYLKDYDNSIDVNEETLKRVFKWKCIGNQNYEQPKLVLNK